MTCVLLYGVTYVHTLATPMWQLRATIALGAVLTVICPVTSRLFDRDAYDMDVEGSGTFVDH